MRHCAIALDNFTHKLYRAEAVRDLDRLAIAGGIPGYTLMRRAGRAAFDCLLEEFPDTKKLLVLCGAGNNAGDGYVVARLARQHGMTVQVISMIGLQSLKGDAKLACEHWQECGDVQAYDGSLPFDCDVIVDALLGTGVTRDVEGPWCEVIEAVNNSCLPVLAIDIPSGLHPDTGCILGCAIQADLTTTFIGMKKGLFTASGKACCGEVIFDDLGVDAGLYEQVSHDAQVLGYESAELPPRRDDSHKGDYGHVLIVGGNLGMPGATVLAARAALRSGAGLVSVVVHRSHVNAVVAACPEAMVYGSINGEIPPALLERASYISIGSGLGQDAWAQRLLYEALLSSRPMVLDADALNLLARQAHTSLIEESIITPHPGEAARLLKTTTKTVQGDRYAAATALQQKYGTVVVLKGSGTIIQSFAATAVCPFGNPAMATAGMGDVLNGIISAVAAGQHDLERGRCAEIAVCMHALAGDDAASRRQHILATDVIDCLP